MKNTQPQKDNTVQITFLQLLKSALAAFIGVQSDVNRERDFKYGKVSSFIGVGLVLALLFIVSIVAVVQVVIRVAG